MQRILGRLPQRPRRCRIDADRSLQCRRTVHRQERSLRQLFAILRHASSAETIWRDIFSCIAINGLSAVAGFRSLRTCSAIAAT